MQTNYKERWAIVYLVYADFISQNDGNSVSVVDEATLHSLDSLCEDLLRCQLDKDKLSLYVVFSTLNFEKAKSTGEIESKSQTILFSVSTPDNQEKNKVTAYPFLSRKTKQSLSVHKVPDLSEVFARIYQMETEKYPNTACKVHLTTWSHGSAFGMFLRDQPRPKELFRWQDIADLPYNYHVKEFIHAAFPPGQTLQQQQQQVQKKSEALQRTAVPVNVSSKKYFLQPDGLVKEFTINSEIPVSADFSFEPTAVKMQETETNEFSLEILTNTELAAAIKDGFPRGEVDVLVMMNCWMMNVDTAYCLRNSVRYLVACQTGIEFPAYNYASMLRQMHSGITTEKSLDPEELVKHCLASLKDTTGKRASDRAAIETWAIFAMDLKATVGEETAIDKLTSAVSDLALYLFEEICKDSSNEAKHFIRFVSQLAYGFDEGARYYQRDILHVIYNMQVFGNSKLDSFKLADLNAEILECSNALTVEKHCGNNWENKSCYSVRENIAPTGLSVFLPHEPFESQRKFRLIIKPDIKGGFYGNCVGWMDFLNALVSEQTDSPEDPTALLKKKEKPQLT